MADAPAPRAVWWQSGLVATLIGLFVSAATLIQGTLQKERELKLQQEQHAQQIRIAYMNVLVESGLEGLGVMADFIADTEPDPVIQQWAIKQREKAREAALAAEQRLVEERKKAAEAAENLRKQEERAARAEAEAERLRTQAQADRAARDQASADARKARAEAEAARAAAGAAEDRVVRAKERLSGKSVLTPPASDTANLTSQRTLIFSQQPIDKLRLAQP